MRRTFAYLMVGMFLLLSVHSVFSGTLKILLVDDDNYSSPDHLPYIEQAITDAGYTYDLFNAQDSARSPDAALMSQYNLVFWYNANDGVGGYFWDGRDTVNTQIVSYLNQGGWMWIMGNDIIYDRYGGAPDTFSTGDFLYDYFGLQRYDVQSKKDDGGSGVPMLIRVPGQDVASAPDTIRWKYSGLYYVDGCTLRPEAQAVYNMGDDSYVLAGYTSASFYDNGTFKAFGCYFDAYYIKPEEDRTTLFKSVLDYFASQLAPTFPPTEFSLQQPENGRWFAVGQADDFVHFSWEKSSDPDGTPVIYRLYLGTTADVSESSVLEMDTSATAVDISNRDLQNLVAVGDTLHLYWSVRAKDGEGETTWASDTFAVTLVNIENQPPSAFHLQQPEDGASYAVTNMTDSLVFSWQSSNDPEGGTLQQTFYYWSSGEGAFHEMLSVPQGEHSAALSNERLLSLLGGQDSLRLLWTVVASDVFGAETAADTFAVVIINQYNVITQGPELQYPVNHHHFFFRQGGAAELHFSWKPAQAYHNPLYTVKVRDEADNVVLQSDTTGTETTLNFAPVLDALTADTVNFTWNVTASLTDSVHQMAVNGPYTLTFVRQVAKVMVVFDDNHTNHNDIIRDALNDLNLDYTDFDCGNDGSDLPAQIPTFDQLKANDLVFWFTGNDGKGLALWNGHDTLNTDLQHYLDNGGKLWVAGIDFLYDLYGGAPDTFQAGDFVFDYLGISSYDAQSKKDDGGKGLPMAILDRNDAPQGLESIDTLLWKYSTLWYVDAITPVEGAKVVYRMGPADYALAGDPVFICYQTPDFLTLTTTFNPRQFKEDEHRKMLKHFLFDGLNWMQRQTLTALPGKETVLPTAFTISQNFPNPFNPTTSIPVALPATGKVALTIYNVLGQKIVQKEYRLSAGRHLLRVNGLNMASGIYYYQVTFKKHSLTGKMILLK